MRLTLPQSFTHPEASVVKDTTTDSVYVASGMSIQTAISGATAGDTINVAAGNYPERIVIDKPLSLVGAGVGQSVIDGTAFGGPPFGFIVDITALTGNTKIEGFDIKTGDWNTGIHSSGGTDAAGKIEILNNHIISTNFDSGLPPSQQMQYGIIAGYLDVRKLVISGNEISDTYDNSILVELQMGETEITNNVFNGAFPSVFFMTYSGHDVTPLQKVSGNTFDMSGAEVGSGAAAIGINPSTYYVGPADRTGKYANFEISGNTITGISDISIKGISVGENSADGVAGGFTNLDIFGNTISGTNGKGIQLFGHITGANIYDNTLTGLAQGMRLFTYESSYYPEGNTIENNQISGASAYLINYEGSAPVDLSGNWWGTSDGATIYPKMTSGVEFSPWCGDSACATTLSFSPGMTIQAAVNAAIPGTTINIPAGTYTEQISITKSLQLIGEDRNNTFIGAPSTMPAGDYSNDTNSQIVRITGTSVNAEVTGFTIHGPVPGTGSNIFAGVYIGDNAHGNIHDNKILDIRNNPLSGAQGGIGILVGRYQWGNKVGTADITNNEISGFQKGGISVGSAGSSAIVTGNVVTGVGPTSILAQNGIQFGFGASGEINNNQVSNISYTGGSTTSTGILLFDAGTVDVSGNMLIDTQVGIYSLDTNGTYENNTINLHGIALGNPPGGFWGIYLDGGTNIVQTNTLTSDNSVGGVGFEVDGGNPAQYSGWDTPINTSVSIIDNNIMGWDKGAVFYQCEGGSCATTSITSIEFEFNEVAGNTSQFENLNVSPAIPGSPNWWGGAGDPGFDLDEISYSPWCADLNCTTFGYFSSEIQDQLDLGGTVTLAPGFYDSLVFEVPGTTLNLLDGAEVRPSAGPCFQINANGVTIKAANPGMAKCVPPNFYNGLELLTPVSGLVVQNLEFDGSAVNTLDGLNIGKGLTNFQFLNNYIHDFDRDGIRFTPGAAPAGSMVMAGNLFAKNSGYGVNNLTPVSLTTTYNSWNDVKGPTGTNGDGVYGKQTYKPFVNADLLATSSGTSYTNKVTTTGTITYAVKVNAASLYGAQFDLEFDETKLNLLSITDSNKLVHDAVCPISTLASAQTSGLISYCGKGKVLNGTITLYTLKFQVKPGTLAGDTMLDFVNDSMLFSSNSAGASNFVYPGSMTDVTLNIYDPANTTLTLAAQILLQGRSDNSENLHEPGRRCRELCDR